SCSVSGTVCRSGVLVRVLGVDAQAREQAGQERRECDVGRAGRGDVAGGRQGRTGVAALRRVEEAAGVAAEQAVVLGAGVGGAAGGLAAGAAVVCRAAGTGAGGLRPAGLGRVAGGRAAAALAPTVLALAGGGLGQEGLERGDVLVYGVEHRGDLLADVSELHGQLLAQGPPGVAVRLGERRQGLHGAEGVGVALVRL